MLAVTDALASLGRLITLAFAESLARPFFVSLELNDGNDIAEVWRSSKAAIERARVGHGPTFLVYDTYRYLEHVGPGLDIDIGYRTQDEWNEWRNRDVIDRLREELRANSVDWVNIERNIEDEIAAEIREAFDFAIASPYPAASDLMSFVHPRSQSADE